MQTKMYIFLSYFFRPWLPIEVKVEQEEKNKQKFMKLCGERKAASGSLTLLSFVDLGPKMSKGRPEFIDDNWYQKGY